MGVGTHGFGMEIDYNVTHYPLDPRVSTERAIEVVRLEETETANAIVYKFARIGGCVDAWEFVEVDAEGEIIQSPENAFTRETAAAVLKETPCVSIRDSDNNTIADIEYAEYVDSVNHLIE